MTTALRVAFCVYREAAGPVFASQVVGPVNWLKQQGFDVSLVSFLPVGTWFRSAARRRLSLLQESVRIRIGEKAVWLPAAPSRIRFDPLATIALSFWLRRQYRDLPVILHCRGNRATELGLKVRERLTNVVVVFDCRGIDDAEFRYENVDTGLSEKEVELECQKRRARQDRCVLGANKVLCVSEAMSHYFEKEYGLSRDRVDVIPSLVDVDRFVRAVPERDQVRSELGFQGKFVVTYSGSLHAWQVPEQCFRVFELIRKCKSNAHFFALTTEPDAMRQLAQKHGLQDKDMTVKRVYHEQVPRYLAAGDIGLLLREPSLVNRVASPVKFGEYLSVGVPVIMTEGIGDCSEWARRHSIGVVYEHGAKREEIFSVISDFIKTYDEERTSIRERCQDVAKRNLSYYRRTTLLDRVYSSLVFETT